jgi:hypothetical protein
MTDPFISQVLVLAALTIVRTLDACKEFFLTGNQAFDEYVKINYKAIGVKMAFIPFTFVGLLISFEIAIIATPFVLGIFYYFIKNKEDKQKNPKNGVLSVQYALDLLFQYLTIVCLYFYANIVIPN